MEKQSRFLFLASVLIFMIGLVCSKALISIGSVGIIISTASYVIINKRMALVNWKEISGYGLLLFLPLISGLWSSNTGDWINGLLNKIMLPALAIGILCSVNLKKKEYFYLSLFQLCTVVLGSLYSISAYFIIDFDINKSYLTAKTLPVLLNNDHLHFSLYVIITLLMVYHNRDLYKVFLPKSAIYSIVLCVSWLTIYIHILGAKTGLIFLYFSAMILVFSNEIVKKPIWHKLSTIPLFLFFLILAYNFIPSFYNRFHYTRYDFNQYIHGEFINGLTDGARVLSWKAGMEIAGQNPLLGLGFGDMNDAFMLWHSIHSKHLEKYNWLQPSNEWLMYFCGSGILGLISLSVGLFLIYWYARTKNSISFFILFITQVLMMWYEVNLNNQIGISLFVFSLCWISLKPVDPIVQVE